MQENISVRQWQERFRAGAFNATDHSTQCEAGWYDWFCQEEDLADRLKEIGEVVMGITDPYILDNYYIWFKNNCSGVGLLYDDVLFEPLAEGCDGKGFLVTLDSPYESMRWTLTTERSGFDASEFECENIQKMIEYINQLGPELEQGTEFAGPVMGGMG